MKEKYNNILKEDIVVPDIVQQKVVEAYLQIKERGTEDMKKKNITLRRIMKPFIAAGICAALVIVAGKLNHFSTVSEISETDMAESHIVASEDGDLAQVLSKMFTMKVYAVDYPDAGETGYVTLNAGDSILVKKNGLGYVLCEGEDGFVSYCIETKFLCEGENIESITYSINEGAFQIVERPDESILIAGDKYDGILNTGLIGGEDSDTLDNPESVYELYKSFTLSYDNQVNDHTWINICNETNRSWDFLKGENMTLESRVAAIEEMMKNVKIACTVRYTDGTTCDAYITIGGGISTPETGIPEKDVPYADFEFRLEP